MKRAAACAAVLDAGALLITVPAVGARAAGGAGDEVTVLGPPAPDAPVYDHHAPDPDVIRVTTLGTTTYYAYTTGTGGGHIPVLSSPDLRTWTFDGDALPTLPGWSTPGRTWGPGVVELGATFVLYYATEVTATGQECISEATASLPTGPFTDKSPGPMICQASLGGSIDPSPFVDSDGTAYLDWKSNDGSMAQPAHLWAQRLSADGSALVGTPTDVLEQDQSWEATIEGPAMVLDGGEYVLFYSGGLWRGPGYGVGYALCQGPLGPCAKPRDGPILYSDQHRLGPGGQSLFTDSAGDLFVAYGAWDGPTSSFSYAAGAFRSLWIASVTFAGGPVVHAGETPQGYFLAAADGGVFAFGAAVFRGSMGGQRLAAPVVGLAVDRAGSGYWLAGADGGVFAFGAPFDGSMGGHALAAPVVGMAASPDGGGYWLVAADGGVFAFGDAAFLGSMGGHALAAPVVGMAPMPQGGGYWLAAADGGVFAFGGAFFFGSKGGTSLGRPVVACAAGPGGGGYWLAGADGGVFPFGDGDFFGSMSGTPLRAPVVAEASTGP